MPLRQRCRDCFNAHRTRNRTSQSRKPDAGERYVPIDDIVQMPKVRVLRAIRHMGWVEAPDLYEAMDLDDDRRIRSRHHTGLSRAVAAGHVERRVCTQRRTDGNGNRLIEVFEYRITQAGRDALRAVLADYDRRLGEGVAA